MPVSILVYLWLVWIQWPKGEQILSIVFFFTSNVRLLACPNLNVKSTWSGIKWLKSVLIWRKKNVIKFRWIKSDAQLWSHYLTLLSEVWCQIVIFKSKQIFWKSKRISIITFNSNVLWRKFTRISRCPSILFFQNWCYFPELEVCI